MTPIYTERQLDDVLSAPSEADRAAMRAIVGSLLILGAGGKMGPSLAQRARRAADQAGISKSIVAVSRFSDPAAERQLQDAGIETIRADLLDFAQLASLPDAENVSSWRAANSDLPARPILHGRVTLICPRAWPSAIAMRGSWPFRAATCIRSFR
jgi:hypothetical protein